MNSYSFQFDFHPGTDAPPVPAVYNIAYDGRFELTYAYNVTWTGTANRLIYTVAGTGNSPAPSYLFANTAGVLNPYYSERGATILVRLSNSAVRAEKTFTVTLVDATTGATAAVTSAILANAPPIDPHTNDIGLTGTHTQYVVAETQNGQLSIQDTVAGRDGTRTVAKPGLIRFADGTGIFDPIGNAQSNARLYQAAFNRTPDLAGLQYSTALLNAGSIGLQAVADGFLTGLEYLAQYGSTSTDQFVKNLYQNVLHRTLDPSDPLDVQGLQNLTNLANTQGRGAALLAMSDSQENHRQSLPFAGDKVDAETTRLYQGAFNRAPDAPGFNVIQNALRGGVPVERVAQGFVASDEFQRAYGTLSNTDFVAQLYRNVLHREADASGQTQFMRALDTGYSRGFVLAALADSDENRIRTAPATHDAWVFVKS